jgi:hypothetical protein
VGYTIKIAVIALVNVSLYVEKLSIPTWKEPL